MLLKGYVKNSDLKEAILVRQKKVAENKRLKIEMAKMLSSFRRIVEKSDCAYAVAEASKHLPKRVLR